MDVTLPEDLRNESFVLTTIKALPDSQPGVALDIGANFGLYTDLLASKFEQVYAFEADPENMNTLKKNTKSYNVRFIVPAVGIADNAMVKLYRSNDPGGSSTNEESPRFGGWGHTWNNYIWVPTITLDTFYEQHYQEEIKFIKCDVEGAEDYIFEHGKGLLENNRLTMVLECHQPVNFNRLYKLFDDLGYQVFDMNGNRTDHLQRDCHFIVRNDL